jgi:hypothetical protein
MTVTIGYSRIVAGVMALLCAVNLVLGVWLWLLTRNFNISLILGLLLIVVAVGQWTRPYFRVEPKEVIVPALFGPLKRTFPYDKLRLDGNRLVAEHNGIPQGVPVRRWLSRPADWAQLEQAVK